MLFEFMHFRFRLFSAANISSIGMQYIVHGDQLPWLWKVPVGFCFQLKLFYLYGKEHSSSQGIVIIRQMHVEVDLDCKR